LARIARRRASVATSWLCMPSGNRDPSAAFGGGAAGRDAIEAELYSSRSSSASLCEAMCAVELKIGVRTVGEVTILDVAGELDLYTVPRLDEGLRTAATRPLLVVNLSGVAYIDSTALKILTDHQKRIRALHG